ncbi:hypothetical protein H4582DRAFT_2057363 [Lactarius indigo]|nr:hypothetical protein H4582DRAFT_2057363 [Lactarius indigo]
MDLGTLRGFQAGHVSVSIRRKKSLLLSTPLRRRTGRIDEVITQPKPLAKGNKNDVGVAVHRIEFLRGDISSNRSTKILSSSPDILKDILHSEEMDLEVARGKGKQIPPSFTKARQTNTPSHGLTETTRCTPNQDKLRYKGFQNQKPWVRR